MAWSSVKLKDCCTVVGGATPKRNIEEYWGKDVPWVTPKDISQLNHSVLEDAPEYISQKGYESCATYLLPKDSVLLTSRAPIGNVAIAGREMCTNQGFKSLVPGDQVDGAYLYHCMKFSAQRLDALGNGATFKEVSKKVVEEFEIPLPPLAEQKRIAAILDKADAIRRKRQQAIQLADEFLRSVFLDMFGDPVTNVKGWDVKPLNEACNVQGGGTPSKSNNEFWGGDIPWVSPKDMKSRYICVSKDSITAEAIKKSSTKLINPGSILMVVRSGVLKHTVPLGIVTKRLTINQDMKAFKPNEGLETNYLYYCLKCFSNYLLGTVRGTTADNLSSDVLNNLEIPHPPMEMQESFVKLMELHKDNQVRMRVHGEDACIAFNSLSQKAFSGQL